MTEQADQAPQIEAPAPENGEPMPAPEAVPEQAMEVDA